MTTRIISGLIMLTIIAAILFAGYFWCPWVISAFLSFVGVLVVYELIHNAAKVDNVVIVVGACLYSAVTILSSQYRFEFLFVPSVLYNIISVAFIIFFHKQLNIEKIAFIYGTPTLFTVSLCMLNALINHTNGFYYLVLLFCFSSVCDIGAYFTGVTIGKHKLCPEISPKKTIEGAIGGILLSAIFVVVTMHLFGNINIYLLLLTIPLCILGIMGDLFASVIKRSAGIKDFGNLIPGHGGVLDRVDSIIMIVPAMFLLFVFNII